MIYDLLQQLHIANDIKLCAYSFMPTISMHVHQNVLPNLGIVKIEKKYVLVLQKSKLILNFHSTICTN